MDRIATTTSLISGIVDAYNHLTFQNELKEVLRILVREFNSILNENAGEYNLSTANSVRPVKYYSVVGRIKEKDSFHEKLIRGNLIFSVLKLNNFKSKAEITSRRKKVREIIKEVSEDIIGIKILTELEQDCKEVILLLKDKHSIYFNNKNYIYLELDDIEKQPRRMRNGLEFYKINGVYKGSFKFELQIKSKLLSVWGDMDHSMFYKDYSVSPVKENVKDSMINLGSLILQVDRFLLQIRQAEHSFSRNREVIDFTEKFSKQYSQILKEKLGFGYRLEDISEFLFFMYKNLPKKKRDFRARLDFSVLRTKSLSSLIKHYVRVRNKDFNLQIIELVYFNWFSKNISTKNRRITNFNRVIPKLIADYLRFLSSHLRKQYKYNSTYLESNFEKICMHLNTGALLYNFEKLNSFFSALANISIYSDIEVGKYNDSQKNDIQNFLLLIYYGENAEDYFKSIQSGVDTNDLIKTLTSIKFSFHDKKIKEIAGFGSTQELIQKGLIILKKLSDEISN
jgi:ppGpp synthetase/RelA/SpoT-type nucleotidyltranferase